MLQKIPKRCVLSQKNGSINKVKLTTDVMMISNTKLDSAIQNITYNEDEKCLGVLTKDGNFRVFDKDLEKIVGGLKSNLPQEHNFRQTQFISSDLKYIVLAKQKTNQATVIDVEKKKKIYTISKNSGEIETLFINNSDKYLVSGGIDGRTYIFNLKNGHFLYNLPVHPDFITAITITNTTQLVATGSYDGTIYVTNLSTLKNPVKLIGHNGYISGIEFLNKGTLVSADKNGNLIIFDFVQRKIKKRLEKVSDHITKIKVDANREFLFVGTKLGRILVYDLINETLFTDNFKKYNAAISDLSLTKEGHLYVGLQNGYIYKENLIDEEKYNSFYTMKEYASIYKALDNSPFVIYTQAYKKTEKRWQEALSSAKELLAHKKIEEAKKLLEPFNDISKKRSVIKSISSEFLEFEKFKNYVDGNKYSLAYQMALKYTSFIDTKEYKKMENAWSKKFNKAQDIILDPRSDEIVKDLLKDFRGIPSKTKQIQQLFKDKVVYNMFKKRLDSRNYKEIFNFIKQYPFLRESEVYVDLKKYADSCYINLKKALSNLDFLKVKEYMEILEGFEEYELKDIKNEMTMLIQLTQYCKNSDRIKIFEIIDNLNYDVELDCVIRIKKEWESVMTKADILSFRGDVQGMIELFKNYFIIKSKSTIIKKYILSAYAQKLERLMRESLNTDKKTKEVIKSKILKANETFGTIEEIKSIVYSFNSFYNESFSIDDEIPEQNVSKKIYISFFG